VQQATITIRSSLIGYEQLMRCAWLVLLLHSNSSLIEEMTSVPKVENYAHYGID